MKSLWLLVSVVFLAGCFTARTYTIEKPRVDTDIEGNQGYLSGTPKPEVKASRLGPNRKISILEIELEPSKRQGVIVETKDVEPQIVEEFEIVEPLVLEEDAVEQEYEYYTVQGNDTLQKISYKFYGTTRRWKTLYNKNKDVLKSPNKVYPGVKLKIPVLN
jgi:LysM repeat protein